MRINNKFNIVNFNYVNNYTKTTTTYKFKKTLSQNTNTFKNNLVIL